MTNVSPGFVSAAASDAAPADGAGAAQVAAVPGGPPPLPEAPLPEAPVAADTAAATAHVASPPATAPSIDAAAAAPASTAAVLDALARLDTRMASLGDDFALKLKFDQSKDRTIDSLNDELRQHRSGLHYTLVRPLLADLVALHDDLVQLADAKKVDDPASAHTFEGLASTVEELLARQGVSTFTVAESAFDGKRQRAARTVATDRPELAGTVARRLRVGFAYNERIVRPEHVAVYVLQPAAPTGTPAASAS